MTRVLRSGAGPRSHTLVASFAAVVLAAAPALRAQTSTAYEPRGAAELAQLVDGLGMTARVLVVGAHPDDEDTRLVAYLARGRHAETAYLSLTRGDGGQNLIGNELGEALGAIRTEELLAARRIDGGRQYFTRAFDFGFSKTAEETFRHWPRDTVLGDVVRVVRAFRPQVMIAIFSGTPADGHGHHQASGILAREAYDAAGDTARFPVAQFGAAWSAGKFYRNTSYRGSETATLRYNAGRYDPVLGRSYAEIAAISRSQHKSQGQGGLERKGVSVVSMRREATRVNAGTPANQERDLFDGIDTTLARVAGGAPNERGTDAVRARAAFDSIPTALIATRAAYDARDPARDVAPLARVTRLLRTAGALDLEDSRAPNTPVGRDYVRTLGDMERRATDALAVAAGIVVEVTVPREVIASGDTVPLTLTVYNRGRAPIAVAGGALFDDERTRGARASDLRFRGDSLLPDSAFTFARTARVVGASEPWWLARPRVGDLFTVPLDGRAEEEHEPHFASLVGNVDLATTFASLGGTPVYRYVDPVRGEVDRPAAVVPAISVTLDRPVQYARVNVPLDRVITVHLRSASTSARPATVRLELPAGLTADSAARTVTLPGYDARAAVDFHVRGTLRPGRSVLRASAESNGERFTGGYQLVDYEHIRPQRIYHSAETAIEAVDVALPARANVAYVPGVGDNVAPTLADLGLPVTVLDSTVLGGDLARYTQIVVGPRAYESNAGLVANNARLLDWVRRGGTMVVQYGQYEMTRPGIMPYPITLARPAARVTIEEALVTVLDSTAGVLTAPNRIGAADWLGWVQERSTYMPQTADPRYRTVLAINDPGEAPNANGILVASVGRGTYVYVTLALFRQLPAGVPGAARLMANLLAAGAGAVSAGAARPAAGR